MLTFNLLFFFFNHTATTEIYTLSLHDALPIFRRLNRPHQTRQHAQHAALGTARHQAGRRRFGEERSEEHTSELQSRQYLVCRLLLEKKKKKTEPRARSSNE